MSNLHDNVTTGQEEEFSMGWELLGKRAYRKGDWKIVWQPEQGNWEPWINGIKSNQWQLYKLQDDPAELHDLSTEYPEKKRELIALWDKYVKDNGLVLPDWISAY
jgi:arylsulfatase|tara:strand:- start:7174 stop:7488 length:315 start_codon:yes stop_codon:yes gene_type:complete